MSPKFKNFFKRFLIFQFAFLFIFSKATNINKSIKDFTKRIKFLAKNSNLREDYIKLIELKSETIFKALFIAYFLMALLALLDMTLGKQFTGLITIFMALIYCNPLTTIKKNYEKNNYQINWKIYIPSMEFCVIFCLGIAMMLSSLFFPRDETENRDNDENEEIKEIKLNNDKKQVIRENKIIEDDN